MTTINDATAVISGDGRGGEGVSALAVIRGISHNKENYGYCTKTQKSVDQIINLIIWSTVIIFITLISLISTFCGFVIFVTVNGEFS